jgi:hypothetical protein
MSDRVDTDLSGPDRGSFHQFAPDLDKGMCSGFSQPTGLERPPYFEAFADCKVSILFISRAGELWQLSA